MDKELVAIWSLILVPWLTVGVLSIVLYPALWSAFGVLTLNVIYCVATTINNRRYLAKHR